MKRYFWLLTLLVSLSMTACDSDSGSSSEGEPENPGENTRPEEQQDPGTTKPEEQHDPGTTKPEEQNPPADDTKTDDGEGKPDINPEPEQPKPDPEDTTTEPPETKDGEGETQDEDEDEDKDEDNPETQCTVSCSEGEIKCSESQDGILKCVVADGCPQWEETKCEADKPNCYQNQCVAQCHDDCKESEKRCNGAEIQECAMIDGCLGWKTVSTCSEAEGVCQPDSFKCGFACGDPNGETCKPFTIVFLPDTQRYTQAQIGDNKKKKYADRFSEQTKYIVDNAKKNNTKMVIHLGDITNFNDAEEWNVASRAIKKLADANLPHLILPGNHDFRKCQKCTSGAYEGHYVCACNNSKYFDGVYNRNEHASGFRSKFIYKDDVLSKWPKDTKFGEYIHNTNSYATLTLGTLKFLFIALEFAPRKDVVCWAERLIKKYSNHYVIITTHSYYKKNKAYSGGAYIPLVPNGVSGEELANELAKKFSNVIMVASGHVGTTGHRLLDGNNGNKFIEMSVDYSAEQDGNCAAEPNAGNGWMRILTIDPKAIKNNLQFTSVSAAKKTKFSCSRYSPDPNADPHKFSESVNLMAPANGKYKIGSYAFGAREINKELNGYQLSPSIGMSRSTGDFVAVWQDNSTTGTKDDDGTFNSGKSQNYDIVARIFCGTGCNQLDGAGKQISQFFVNEVTKGHQYSPSAAMDDNGNFVVVWVDDQKNTGKGQIFMRGFDAMGKERFKTTTVNTNTSGDHNDPKIAMTKDGSFVVAWEDASASSKTPQIYVRGFNSNGTEKFAQHNVLDADKGVRENPDIAIADDGSFVVAWQDDTDSNGSYQVRARVFKADGNADGNVFTVNSEGAGQQKNPAVAMNPENGTFFIAYEDNSNKNSTFGVKVRGYSKDKKIVFEDQYMNFQNGYKAHTDSNNKTTYTYNYSNTPTKGRPQRYPDVCLDKYGNAYVTWFGENHRELSIYDSPIVSPDVQKIKIGYSNGKYTLADKPEQVNYVAYEVTETNNVSKQPVIECNNAGNHVILWREMLDKKKVSEIYGRGF